MAVHHYTECGLQNVYINGILPVVDAEGHNIIVVSRVNQLHRVIAEGIVSHPKGMVGAELRFLRSEMGYTQSELASFVHRDKQTIGRWERSEIEIDSVAEAVIRKMAIEKLALTVNLGMEQLARSSVPTAQTQPINISVVNDSYELKDAA
jgi:transcriptional regulator with XRE-family HTH domain